MTFRLITGVPLPSHYRRRSSETLQASLFRDITGVALPSYWRRSSPQVTVKVDRRHRRAGCRQLREGTRKGFGKLTGGRAVQVGRCLCGRRAEGVDHRPAACTLQCSTFDLTNSESFTTYIFLSLSAACTLQCSTFVSPLLGRGSALECSAPLFRA